MHPDARSKSRDLHTETRSDLHCLHQNLAYILRSLESARAALRTSIAMNRNLVWQT